MIFVPQLLISNTVLISTLVLPTLLQDTIDRADKWGDDGRIGRIDPFTEVYDVSLFGNVHFLGLVLSYPRSARVRHDRPCGHMS